MSLALPSEPTNEETRHPATDEDSAAQSRRPRGDGDDPPHDEDQSKTGYPVVSRGPQARGDGDDPPHDEDQSKTGYPVASE